VKCFDKAFHSRISVALQYEDLDVKSRTKVWENMFDAAGLDYTEYDTKKLGDWLLNGRQIRTITRLALSLAKKEGKVMSMQHLLKTIEITLQFQTDFAAMQEEKNTG